MSAADGYRARAAALDDFKHDALKRHGMTLRKKLVVSAKKAAGPDRALSGLGNDPKLGVRLRTERGRVTSSVTLSPSPKRAKAPWSWMEQGTRPGWRRSRKIEGTSRTQAQITGVGAYYHPGAAGKGAWFGVTDPYLLLVEQDLRRQFDAASRR